MLNNANTDFNVQSIINASESATDWNHIGYRPSSAY